MKPRLGTVVPLFLLTLGVLFVVIGTSFGGAREVMNKAIRICLECIGIG